MADALVLEKELWPEFGAGDLVKLPNYHAYLKLMIDGAVSRPFSASTMTELVHPREGALHDPAPSSQIAAVFPREFSCSTRPFVREWWWEILFGIRRGLSEVKFSPCDLGIYFSPGSESQVPDEPQTRRNRTECAAG
jgi:hypothetical protein